jgi:hypothetical protein
MLTSCRATGSGPDIPLWLWRAGLKEEILERPGRKLENADLDPRSACMANMDDRLTGQSQCDWQEGVVIRGS